MATYLPNLSDFIPQAQPFKPDLNFYGNVLQKKQSQYDKGYDQMSSIYASALNSPLTRDNNIARRDNFFKAIDQDIKKVSGLDLSLQENQQTAMNIFKPFWEDKYMMKDMATTKNIQSQFQKGESFKNCIDKEKCGGEYWEGGMRKLQYMLEEFRNASDEESLEFGNVRFVPFQNVTDMAMKFAKANGFAVTSVQHSKDGKWIITDKNGVQMSPGLTQTFIAEFSNNPKVMDMYQDQAYLSRKDYVKTHSQRIINGQPLGEQGAENEYLQTKLSAYEKKLADQRTDAQKTADFIENQKQVKEKELATEGMVPGSDSAKAFESLFGQSETMAKVNDHYDKQEDVLNSGAASFSTGNIRATRAKIDRIMAGEMFNNEMGFAANAYAQLHSEQTIKEDPYYMKSYDHSLQMSRLNQQHKWAMQMAETKAQVDLAKSDYLIKLKWNLDNNPSATLGTTVNATPTTYDKSTSDSYKEGEGGILLEQTDERKHTQDVASSLASQYVDKTIIKLKGVSTNTNISKAERDIATRQLELLLGDKAYKAYEAGKDWRESSWGQNPMEMYKRIKNLIDRNKDFKSLKGFEKTELEPLNQGLENQAGMFKIFDDQMKANNKRIKTYAQSQMGKGGLDNLISTDGNVISFDYYASKMLPQAKAFWKEQHRENPLLPSFSDSKLYEYINDNYNDMVAKYKEYYNSGVTVGGKPLVTTMTMGKGVEGSSGKTSMGGMQYELNPLTNLNNNKLITEFVNASFEKGLVGVQGGVDIVGTEFTGEIDAPLKNIARTFIENLSNPLYNNVKKMTSKDLKEMPTGSAIYFDIGANDRNKKAVTIRPSIEWWDAHTGTPTVPGITYGMKRQDITLFVDKNAVNTTLTQSYEHSPEYIRLKGGETLYAKSTVGNISFKMNENGNIVSSGGLSQRNLDGTFMPTEDLTHVYGNVEPSILLSGTEELLKKMDARDYAIQNHLDRDKRVYKKQDLFNVGN